MSAQQTRSALDQVPGGKGGARRAAQAPAGRAAAACARGLAQRARQSVCCFVMFGRQAARAHLVLGRVLGARESVWHRTSERERRHRVFGSHKKSKKRQAQVGTGLWDPPYTVSTLCTHPVLLGENTRGAAQKTRFWLALCSPGAVPSAVVHFSAANQLGVALVVHVPQLHFL